MEADRIEKFDSRVTEFVKDSAVSLSNREIDKGELQRFSYRLGILDDRAEIYELSLGELRELARILTDLVVNSPENPQTLDHIQYWAWTAAFASTTQQRLPRKLNSSMGDFLDLVALKVSTMRRAKILHLIMNKRVEDQEIPSDLLLFQLAASFDPLIFGNYLFVDRIASTMGFSVLEGLIATRCSDLDSETGELTADVDVTWYDGENQLNKGENPNIHKKIQIWREFGSSEEVGSIIDQINQLDRYNTDVLTGTFQGVESRVYEELGETNHLTRVIAKQRGDNIHASRSTRSIGTIVLNLCSLLIWDMILPDVFERDRKKVLNEVGSSSGIFHNYTPSDYLPVFRL
ncbi:hypothetical protein [Halobellus ruber]|uniref:Uncharacterized protein n=1 Tax=Halobellus ruber TaxID=2761102 RepID=A0A7J9SJU9_9EURY|nr:hypothetical protein [Halobellus ruber]MBB6645291.1 hypothetical protein [Halobellus ruber]